MAKEFSVGDILFGFTVVSVKDIPSYRGRGVLLRHKSGFEVYALSNDDSECFFNYTIYTPPVNNTGVFHILEHTILTGSKKYPVRDPFMMMVRNSCNTFLNAMTGPDRTYFPAASPVKKDFDNIFNVYTDAVFDPLLRKESFQQEGIRLSGKNGLHFEGVVFSEMQGDISQHDSVVSVSSTRPLFDSCSPYRYEFGGDPIAIPDLSYEEFVATYKKHYVPANMTLFLYGNLDICEKLEYLDREYLEGRDPGKKVSRANRATRWTEPQYYEDYSNADDDIDSSTTMVSWLLGDCDNPDLNTELAIVVDLLLGSPGAPLYKAIIDSSLGRDLSSESGMADSFRELVFSVGIDGTDEKKRRDVEEYILSSLKKITSLGLSSKEIEASIRRFEFRLQEIPSGMPLGYTLFFSRIDKGWAFGKDPSDMLFSLDALKRIRKQLESDPRYFDKWIEKNIINNTHRLTSVVIMDKDTQRKIDQGISEKVKLHSNEYSSEEEEAFDLFEESEDSPEAVENLPRLSSKDIPNVKVDFAHTVDGNLIMSDFFSGGVVYADMAFNVADLEWEELEDLSLLSRLLLMTNVDGIDYSAFLTELRFTTGDANFQLEAGSTWDGEEGVYLFARFKALAEYYEDALSLFEKLFYKADVFAKDRIKAALADIDSDYQSSVIRAGHQFASGSASACLSPALETMERIQGLEYWYRIKQMQDDIDSLPNRLEKVYRKVFTSNRLTFHLSTDKPFIDTAAKETQRFISRLDKGDEHPIVSKRDYSQRKRKIAYTLSTPVNYISIANRAADQDTKEGNSERMLLSIVSKNSLWSLIREKGGAYGAGAVTDTVEDVFYFYTYRDPRLDESIKDFKRAIEEETITEEKLEDGRLNVLSRDVKPLGPATKAMIDFRRYLYRIPDEKRHIRKDLILSAEVDDLERARKRLLDRLDDVSLCAITSSQGAVESSIEFEIESLPIK